MEAAMNLFRVLSEINPKGPRDGSSGAFWAGTITQNSLLLRLHNLKTKLAHSTNGICPKPYTIPPASFSKGSDILSNLNRKDNSDINSLLNKKSNIDVNNGVSPLIGALKSTSDFIKQVSTPSVNNLGWLNSFRFSPVMSQPPISPESPKWTLAIARLIQKVTKLLTEADQQSNVLHIINQLASLVIDKGNHWLTVLRRLSSGTPSITLPNSDFLDSKTLTRLSTMLDNPNLILSETTRHYAAMKIVNQAPSSSRRKQIKDCKPASSSCGCTEYTISFSFTLPSKTTSCLFNLKLHTGLATSRFHLESRSDLSTTIHTDTEDAIMLEYGFLRIGLLMNPVLRARKSLDVLRIADNIFYFPEAIYKDITVNCEDW